MDKAHLALGERGFDEYGSAGLEPGAQIFRTFTERGRKSVDLPTRGLLDALLNVPDGAGGDGGFLGELGLTQAEVQAQSPDSLSQRLTFSHGVIITESRHG